MREVLLYLWRDSWSSLISKRQLVPTYTQLYKNKFPKTKSNNKQPNKHTVVDLIENMALMVKMTTEIEH